MFFQFQSILMAIFMIWWDIRHQVRFLLISFDHDSILLCRRKIYQTDETLFSLNFITFICRNHLELLSIDSINTIIWLRECYAPSSVLNRCKYCKQNCFDRHECIEHPDQRDFIEMNYEMNDLSHTRSTARFGSSTIKDFFECWSTGF